VNVRLAETGMKRNIGGLPIVIAGLLLLGTAGCKPSYPSAFRESATFWHGLKGGGVDSALLARCIAPMVNPGGIEYLIGKMNSGSDKEREIAVVCLATIYGVLLDAPGDESRRMRGQIAKSALLEKVALYAEKGSNEEIRESLSAFEKMPKREAATPLEVSISGEETWIVDGRAYRIHDTRIMMRRPKGPLYVVVVDQCRGAPSEMVNAEPQVLPSKAIAEYALANGYFAKAKEARVAATVTQLQDRIDVWTGGKTPSGYGVVSSFEGGWHIRNLAREERPNEAVEGTH